MYKYLIKYYCLLFNKKIIKISYKPKISILFNLFKLFNELIINDIIFYHHIRYDKFSYTINYYIIDKLEGKFQYHYNYKYVNSYHQFINIYDNQYDITIYKEKYITEICYNCSVDDLFQLLKLL